MSDAAADRLATGVLGPNLGDDTPSDGLVASLGPGRLTEPPGPKGLEAGSDLNEWPK